MADKVPDPIDAHVGNRIRTRRMALGMSQEKLGDRLGLSFQQVQKYEKGTNRVGASRLQAICAILQVPVSYFFDGAPHASASTRTKTTDDGSTELVAKFIASGDGQALIKAFLRIKAPEMRRSLVQMVKAVGDSRTSDD